MLNHLLIYFKWRRQSIDNAGFKFQCNLQSMHLSESPITEYSRKEQLKQTSKQLSFITAISQTTSVAKAKWVVPKGATIASFLMLKFDSVWSHKVEINERRTATRNICLPTEMCSNSVLAWCSPLSLTVANAQKILLISVFVEWGGDYKNEVILPSTWNFQLWRNTVSFS